MQDNGYVLITGATGGLGKAFATLLAEKGENVILTGRSAEKLNSLKEELLSIQEIKVLTFPCDLANEGGRYALMNFIESSNCVLSGLINVAGADIQRG